MAPLVDYSGDISWDWYIEFSIWIENKNDLDRKRVSSGINKHKIEKDRRAQAQLMIDEINRLLKLGKVIKKDPVPEPVPKLKIEDLTIIIAIQRYMDNNQASLSKNTLPDYRKLRNALKDWLILSVCLNIQFL
ncbi:hypothetical protein [Adhaeribacter soli]|uniref:Uncharacterized protein n=1 Tax=Adhaeribacter soli TaxID=2607655 RepID=A0A5N1ILG9_9BACT|nr:hypothetical protein [Adhaeribacter soli]KAA9327307.1 hypothetical protein F0P94_15425 [Adhaeribacter soli]